MRLAEPTWWVGGFGSTTNVRVCIRQNQKDFIVHIRRVFLVDLDAKGLLLALGSFFCSRYTHFFLWRVENTRSVSSISTSDFAVLRSFLSDCIG